MNEGPKAEKAVFWIDATGMEIKNGRGGLLPFGPTDFRIQWHDMTPRPFSVVGMPGGFIFGQRANGGSDGRTLHSFNQDLTRNPAIPLFHMVHFLYDQRMKRRI